MFERWDAGKNWSEKVDELERRVLGREAEISRLRAEQADDLRILDQLQVDLGDGDRCMDDWVQAHLDVSHQTAARLMQVARSSDRSTIDKMKAGTWGLDRASLLLRLSPAGATPEQVADAADNYSLGRIYGLILELKEISPLQEQASFEDRYLVIHPTSTPRCTGCGARSTAPMVRSSTKHSAYEPPPFPISPISPKANFWQTLSPMFASTASRADPKVSNPEGLSS